MTTQASTDFLGPKKKKKEFSEERKKELKALLDANHEQQAVIETETRKLINQKADEAIQSYKALGRPRAMTDELKAEVINRLANGQSLTNIAALQHMPSPATIIAETERDRSFLEKYIRARSHQADVLFNQCLDIADNAKGDIIDDGTGKKLINHAAIARDRLKIETRFRMAGKLNAKYADRAALIGENSQVTVNNLSINPRDMTPDNRDKLRKLLLEAKAGTNSEQ